MCLPSPLNFGIYGPTCSGKTYLSDWLAHKLDLPVRHCGNEIKSAAVKAGYSLQALPDEIHQEVDDATLEFNVGHSTGWIIEGRHLSHVLKPICADTFLLIKLACPEEERARRMGVRLARTVDLSELRASDLEDEQFRQRMYGDVELQPHLVITSNLPPELQWDKIYQAVTGTNR